MNYLDKNGLTRLWSKITSKLGQKQDTLVSGTNIKTINNQSVLGSGNLTIEGEKNYHYFYNSWYSYAGLKTLDGLTVTYNNRQVPIYEIVYEIGYSTLPPAYNSSVYILLKGLLKDVKVPSTSLLPDYVDGDTLVIDFPGLVTVWFYIDEHDGEYSLSEADIALNNYASPDVGYYYAYINDEELVLSLIKRSEYKENKVTSISSSSTDEQYPSAKCVYDNLQLKQDSLTSGTNIKTINNQSILGSGNINISGTINSDVEQKHLYTINGEDYYYQFYGVSSIDNITVNVGVEVDLVYATLVLIMQSVEELRQSYVNTVYAIQHIQIPNDVYESNVLIIVIHNLGSMTCYINPSTKYVTHATFTNFANGYSVDLGSDPNQLTVYYSAVDPTNYLSKTNTTSYTPSANYHPATKKYVDDTKAVVIEADLSINPNDYSVTFDRWVTANPYNTVDTANQSNIPVFAKMNIQYEGQTFIVNYMTQTMNNIGDEFKVFSGFFSDETISHVTMVLSESNENNPDLLFREVVYYEGEPHANIADETNTVTVQKFNEVLAVLRSIGAISSD